MQMAYLPDTLVFATLPSTQRCAGWHYRQAGSVSASTHMMPSSFSSIVLTWLLFTVLSSLLQSQALRHNVHVRSGSPPNALHYRTCSIIRPPRINAPPPLQGLSYCAGFLSHKHAPPPSPALTRPYMRVRLLDRARDTRYTYMRL